MEESNQSTQNKQWKIIKEYPNFKVSDTGIVKNFKTGNIIKRSSINGYYIVNLTDAINDRSNIYLVHRLIAEYFIDNPDPINFNIVDHIDGNKINNNISNLRWIDPSGNTKNWQSQRNDRNKVIQYDLNNEIIKIWDSDSIKSKKSNNLLIHWIVKN